LHVGSDRVLMVVSTVGVMVVPSEMMWIKQTAAVVVVVVGGVHMGGLNARRKLCLWLTLICLYAEKGALGARQVDPQERSRTMSTHARQQRSNFAPPLLLLLHACTCIHTKSLPTCSHARSYCTHANDESCETPQHRFGAQHICSCDVGGVHARLTEQYLCCRGEAAKDDRITLLPHAEVEKDGRAPAALHGCAFSGPSEATGTTLC
jgi:hypothetical protein